MMNHRQTQKPPRYRVVLEKTEGTWDIQFGTTSKGKIEDLETFRVQEMMDGLEHALVKIRQIIFRRVKDEHKR